ncbi:MAG: hypothetical protein EAZ95_16575 [Bacteroidetes bacterium]|nr:MAG: hypothetical protein EAZ95_16575 [Bacteroidota bacterium]
MFKYVFIFFWFLLPSQVFAQLDSTMRKNLIEKGMGYMVNTLDKMKQEAEEKDAQRVMIPATFNSMGLMPTNFAESHITKYNISWTLYFFQRDKRPCFLTLRFEPLPKIKLKQKKRETTSIANFFDDVTTILNLLPDSPQESDMQVITEKLHKRLERELENCYKQKNCNDCWMLKECSEQK